MSFRPVVLINSNEMRPPVAPLALDYIGDRLAGAGYPVHLVDLSFETDAEQAIRSCLHNLDPIAVGVTFRNTDDCYLASGAWFVPRLFEIIHTLRETTDAPIVLGGCGLSIFPEEILRACKADFIIAGDGEEAFLSLVRGLENGEGPAAVPGLVWGDQSGRIVAHPPARPADLHVPSTRGIIDNARYFREGGMGNVETRRGCPHRCIYCADPVAKGAVVRCRGPAEVSDEIQTLYGRGVDVLHVCDGEFNVPPDYALAICEEITRRGLGERLRWYCYATVHPFSADLAAAMRRAGCVGINFGVDSGCDRMLCALRRGYRRDAIAEAVRHCRANGITVMLDMLIGGPGENATTVADSIAYLKSVGADRIGAATGLRVYPRTPLAAIVRRQGLMADNPNLRGVVEDNGDLLRPVFYLDRNIGDDPFALVNDLIAGDERFFPPPRSRDAPSYNYNDNRLLETAITAGHRGAFWDILRQCSNSVSIESGQTS